jgi:hypothetical protein
MKFFDGGGQNLTKEKPKLYSAAVCKLLRDRLRLISFLVDYQSGTTTAREVATGKGRQKQKQTVHYFHAHNDLRDLLHVLQSKYPVAALVPTDTLANLKAIIDTPNLADAAASDRQALTSHLRQAIDFFVGQPQRHVDLIRLLKKLHEVSSSPSQEIFNEIPLETTARKGISEFFYSGCWYPKNPLLRSIPPYLADKNLTSMVANKIVHLGPNVTTPGLFLVFCHEHEQLIGFHMLKYYESCRTVHDLF